MTAIIKAASESARVVRPLDWRETQHDAAIPHDPAIEALEAEVEELRSALAEAETRHDQALIQARLTARAEAEAQFRRDEEQSLNLLRSGISAAQTALANRMESLDAIAVAVADHALAGVFHEPADMQALLTNAMRKQISDVRRELVLRVAVSVSDFPNEPAARSLAHLLDGIDVTVDPTLAAGSCVIDLTLGSISLSLPAHWRALQELMAKIAGRGA